VQVIEELGGQQVRGKVVYVERALDALHEPPLPKQPPGVVEQEVEPVRFRTDRLRQRTDRSGLREVRHHEGRLASLLADALHDRLSRLAVAAVHDHLRPEAPQRICRHAADAARGAGDEGRLSGAVDVRDGRSLDR